MVGFKSFASLSVSAISIAMASVRHERGGVGTASAPVHPHRPSWNLRSMVVEQLLSMTYFARPGWILDCNETPRYQSRRKDARPSTFTKPLPGTERVVRQPLKQEHVRQDKHTTTSTGCVSVASVPTPPSRAGLAQPAHRLRTESARRLPQQTCAEDFDLLVDQVVIQIHKGTEPSTSFALPAADLDDEEFASSGNCNPKPSLATEPFCIVVQTGLVLRARGRPDHGCRPRRFWFQEWTYSRSQVMKLADSRLPSLALQCRQQLACLPK